jgi:hypothetical protein
VARFALLLIASPDSSLALTFFRPTFPRGEATFDIVTKNKHFLRWSPRNIGKDSLASSLDRRRGA